MTSLILSQRFAARFRAWLPTLGASGVEIHLHDLRHTGNGLVAEAGANLRELMERMG
jgi:integrase